MQDIAILAIWFSSVIGGMVLTMLLPKIFTDSETTRMQWNGEARVPSHDLHVEVFQGTRTSMVLVEEEV